MKKIAFTICAILAFPIAANAQNMNCNFPISQKDSAKTILQRFGKNAKLADINAPEGQVFKGIILYPNNPKRRAEILFFDDELKHPSSIQFSDKSSIWNLSGLKIGDSLGKAVKVNKAAISLTGFDWDYGGYASEFHGGALSEKYQKCTIGIRFEPREGSQYNENLSGDKVIHSSDRALKKLNPAIIELSIGWAM